MEPNRYTGTKIPISNINHSLNLNGRIMASARNEIIKNITLGLNRNTDELMVKPILNKSELGLLLLYILSNKLINSITRKLLINPAEIQLNSGKQAVIKMYAAAIV